MSEIKIAVIGLGYVGLPLARLFATKYPVAGFDINEKRVEDLKNGYDATLEIDPEVLKSVLLAYNPEDKINIFDVEKAGTVNGKSELEGDDKIIKGLFCTSNLEEIRSYNFYIVTVPTPVDRNNRPDLTPLIEASETVGKVIKRGDIVVYESTVYPGATEEDCVPVVEKVSGLRFNVDFFVGYSPERINPGDKEHTVEKIKKVTSGSTPETAGIVDCVYRSVILAGTHRAPSIKVAEAAKVIENSQRDINIAFVNELAKIFNRMSIDIGDVLQAASTKWNFLQFKPGLVGGHCIGVDPYYLAQKAQECGYHSEIILAGRRLNDTMGEYVASEVVKLMVQKGICTKGGKVLILGITFKENCPDIRNTKVTDIYKELRNYGLEVDIYDPWAKPEEVRHDYGIDTLSEFPNEINYNVIVLAVAHKEFKDINLRGLKEKGGIIYDVKGLLDRKMVDARL